MLSVTHFATRDDGFAERARRALEVLSRMSRATVVSVSLLTRLASPARLAAA